ncbi:MAG: cell division protein ZapA [Pseudomonadota bacterium]
MAPIHISILNKPYAVECAPEDAATIHECAEFINKRLREHPAGDTAQTMVLTMLVMASELLERPAQPQTSPAMIDPAALTPLAQRIKTVAKSLQDFQSEPC